ncbi:APC family permease [Pseudomonas sp. URMO17WK12:I11]|uniref:APC family permease n=1 Tax=Pseudomonas sp. URMO17WK12:I11 TaxID=1283291 RepID=UPI00119F7640|nr:APC family permease [Pseudomonas sp. URMO17WK12:I11]
MASDATASLKRVITLPLLVFFILGDVLGAGVYALAGAIADRAGGAIWAPLALALFFALLTAASYAELVSKYPRAGGAAVFARRAFGSPLLAFLVGFAMLAAGITSAAGLALAFAGEYLRVFIDWPSAVLAPLFLVLMAMLNARGIKESLSANLVMTLIELSGLVLVIVAEAVLSGQGQAESSRLLDFGEQGPATAVLGGALLAFYSYVGFETSANLAEEIKDVRRTYPRALFGALLVAGLVYLAVGAGAALVMPVQALIDAKTPLMDIVHNADLGLPHGVFAIIALVAVANGAMLTMIMASRLTWGMARDGMLPRVLGQVLPNRGTPGYAIAATTLLAILLTFTGSLEVLAETVVLLLLFVFLSTNVAVLVLKKDKVDAEHFSVNPLVPVLGILSCLLVLSQQPFENWLRAGALLGLGAVLHWLAGKGVGRTISEGDSGQ